MGKIKQLPAHEIHKIAAGEVVERPANVIKELVENSLDAGARSITVYAEQGGKSLMRVVDDGIGMSSEDACMSIVHHATSKLSTIDDLEHLTTFGFRGEALSSIASVSRMTLVTRDASMQEGLKLTITEGVVTSQELVACNQGTDITITDLFYTVPARKKFLKTDDTEWRNLHQLMQAFALSYPECGFTVYHNGKLVLQCRAAATVADRMKELYDGYLTSSLLSCTAEPAGFNVHGQITNPQFMRYDRNSIFIFVNRRWVKNTKLTHSLMKGYSGVLQPGRYPAAALFITIDPTQVDINIHPRKEEVHFMHPRRVESAIEAMVKARLEEYTARLTIKTQAVVTQPSFQPAVTTVLPQASSHRQFVVNESPTIDVPTQPAQEQFARVLEEIFPLNASEPISEQQRIPNEGASSVVSVHDYRLIGQLLKTYITIENNEGLVLIDQHAAHERILYELFAARFDDIAVVPLLFPSIINLHEHEAQLVEEHSALFARYGIVLDRVSAQQCAVQTVPVMLKNAAFEDIVREVISILHEDSNPSVLENKLHHALRAQMACKAAVKAGDVLTDEHMHELVASLNNAPNRFSCPHGRPTSWAISNYEIEKKFKRKI